jgi:hypothetical protein
MAKTALLIIGCPMLGSWSHFYAVHEENFTKDEFRLAWE